MKLFVGNLSFSTTEQDLEELFAGHGTVSEVSLITDRNTGRSRGFAFVTMSSRSEGEAAIEALEGVQLDGRSITVNEARPKSDRSDRPTGSFNGRR